MSVLDMASFRSVYAKRTPLNSDLPTYVTTQRSTGHTVLSLDPESSEAVREMFGSTVDLLAKDGLIAITEGDGWAVSDGSLRSSIVVDDAKRLLESAFGLHSKYFFDVTRYKNCLILERNESFEEPVSRFD